MQLGRLGAKTLWKIEHIQCEQKFRHSWKKMCA